MAGEVIFRRVPGESTHESDSMVFKTRVNTAWQHYLGKLGNGIHPLYVSSGQDHDPSESGAGEPNEGRGKAKLSGVSLEKRASQYQPREPLYHFEQLIVPDSVKKSLVMAARVIDLERRVFDEWGLRKIEPFPRSALNFYGPPGTGKTLAAHALAAHLGRKILLASYGQIESMYHGEGPKNVEAAFHAAQRDGALLFIDEADSLLSKRLTNVTQGSEQAINSMRSQLLLCLDQFKGVVVFATNLVENYDAAFETRVRNIEFPVPDFDCRRKIWLVHFPPELPLAGDVAPEELANVGDLCGREIRNAVVEAAFQAAMNGAPHVARQDLLDSIDRVKASRIRGKQYVSVRELTEEEQEIFDRAMQGKSDKADVPCLPAVTDHATSPGV
jgi:SpoVK/Ycf46/Vps4 family AAA+-type ATPase